MFFLFRLYFRNNTQIYHCRCDQIYTEAVKCAALLKVTILSRNIFLIYSIMVTVQKMIFSIKYFFGKCDQNPQFPADLVTFTEEILNGKLHFLCSGCSCGDIANLFVISIQIKIRIFFLSGFSFTHTEDLQDSRGLSLFLSTTSTCSVTFKNLLVVLHLRLLPYIFKHSACQMDVSRIVCYIKTVVKQ